MLHCPCATESAAALQPDEQPTKLRQVVRPTVSLSTPEEQHADQDEDGENRIPDKVHPMDALTATKARVLILDIKTIPVLFHLTHQPRQRSSTETNNRVSPLRSNHPVNSNPMTEFSFSLPHVRRNVRKSVRSHHHPSRSPQDHTHQVPCKMSS